MKRERMAIVVVAVVLLSAAALWLGLRPEPGTEQGAPGGGPLAAAPAPADERPSDHAPPGADLPRIVDAGRARDPASDEPPAAASAGAGAARGSVLVDNSSRSQPAARDVAGTAGTLDKEAVKKGVFAATPKIKACYEQALKIQPELAGRVVVEFKIEGNTDGGGEVTSGEIVDSEMGSPFFEACVLKEVAGTSFDAPSGGGAVTVRYPFNFASTDDDKPNAPP